MKLRPGKHARRSLVAKNRIFKGREFRNGDLTWKRPGYGISPKFINQVIGHFASRDINENELIVWDMIR